MSFKLGKTSPKQNTNRRWAGEEDGMLLCWARQPSGRRRTPPLQGPAELGPSAPDNGKEGMALGSASWVSASSPCPGNREAAGGEPGAFQKMIKGVGAEGSGSQAWGGAVQWGQRRRHLEGAPRGHSVLPTWSPWRRRRQESHLCSKLAAAAARALRGAPVESAAA